VRLTRQGKMMTRNEIGEGRQRTGIGEVEREKMDQQKNQEKKAQGTLVQLSSALTLLRCTHSSPKESDALLRPVARSDSKHHSDRRRPTAASPVTSSMAAWYSMLVQSGAIGRYLAFNAHHADE
jgi:hypothetical protein